MLEGIEGATAIMDDILIAGSNTEHHDAVLRQVIERATSYNLKLNHQKCLIKQPAVPYIGHLLTSEGLKPDPSKVAAVRAMPTPKKQRRCQTIPRICHLPCKVHSQPERVGRPTQRATEDKRLVRLATSSRRGFLKLKKQCCSQPVLKYFDVNKPVEIQCDASQHGLGAVLIQDD